MSFWKNFFTKSKPEPGPEEAVVVNVEPLLKKPAGPVTDAEYQQNIDKVIGLLARNDKLSVTMAIEKTLPDLSGQKTSYRNPEAISAPFYAKVFEAGSDSLKLKDIFEKAKQKDLFRGSYYEAARWATALIYTLGVKEGKSYEEIYDNLEKNMAPDGNVHRGLRLAAHLLGAEGVPYGTISDMHAALYGKTSISDAEKERLFIAARDRYLENPDEDIFLVPLAIGQKDISKVVIQPVNRRVVSRIEDFYPSAARWIEASDNVDNTCAEPYIPRDEYGRYLFSDESPITWDETTDLREALDTFEQVRGYFSIWSNCVRDREYAKDNPEVVKSAAEGLAGWLRNGSLFTSVNDVFLAEASGDILEEYEALKKLEVKSHIPTFKNIPDSEKNIAAPIWYTFSSRYFEIKDEAGRIIEDKAKREKLKAAVAALEATSSGFSDEHDLV